VHHFIRIYELKNNVTYLANVHYIRLRIHVSYDSIGLVLEHGVDNFSRF